LILLKRRAFQVLFSHPRHAAAPPKKQNAPTSVGAFEIIYGSWNRRRLVALRVSATAAVAAAITTIAAATAEGTARSAAAAGSALFTRTSFVHGEGTTLHILAVEEVDRLLGVFIGRHRDKGKTTGFARELILHERDFRDRAGLGEGVLKVDFGGVEGKISDVEFAGHIVVSLNQVRSIGGCFRSSDFQNCRWSPRIQIRILKLAIYQT